jgi:hypothetical protein
VFHHSWRCIPQRHVRIQLRKYEMNMLDTLLAIARTPILVHGRLSWMLQASFWAALDESIETLARKNRIYKFFNEPLTPTLSHKGRGRVLLGRCVGARGSVFLIRPSSAGRGHPSAWLAQTCAGLSRPVQTQLWVCGELMSDSLSPCGRGLG